MSTACVVLFHKFEPSQRKNSVILFDYFLRHYCIWGQTVDHLYLIDSGRGIDVERQKQLQALCNNLIIFSHEANSHWENMNIVLPQIREDKLLLIDGDTVFSSLQAVENIYNNLNTYDIVSITDNSGGIDLFNQFPVLAKNEFRDNRRRLCPYLFACKTSLLHSIGPLDFTPLAGDVWTDSMGVVTQRLLELNPSFLELPDDRTSLYFRSNGEHEKSAFLDDPSFEWGRTLQNDYGYYHIQNWSAGHYIVECRQFDKVNFDRVVREMPQQEAVRLLAWLYLMVKDSNLQYSEEIIQSARGFNVSRDLFLNYIKEFQQFHQWSLRI